MPNIEVVYCPEGGPVFSQHLQLPNGATVNDALRESRVFLSYPEAKDYVMGIFSSRVLPHDMVHEGDRVEIYRPLKISPKERRRRKALA